MLTICAWCDCAILPDGRTMVWPVTAHMLATDEGEISHGICLACKDKALSELEPIKARGIVAKLRRAAL